MHIGLVDLRWKGHHTPYVVYLSRYFTERGHKVTFITDRDNPRLQEIPDSENLFIHSEAFPKYDFNSRDGIFASLKEQRTRVQQLRRIFAIAERSGVDIAHLLYFDRTQVPLWLTSKLPQVRLPPVVATLHRDAFTDRKNATGMKRATQWGTRRALSACLANGTLDCLTVHAESIRQRITDTVSAATNQNTLVIPAPTPNVSVDVSPIEAREYLDLPCDEPLFLFFGGLRYEKGPDLLARTLRNVKRDMTVVYAGPEADFIQSDVHEWKQQIPSNVSVVDRIMFIPESQLDYYFAAADALILPYRRTRGISGPLRRAVTVGTPIIAPASSDIGRIVELHDLGVCINEPIEEELSNWFNQYTEESMLTSKEALSRFAKSRHWTATGDSLLEIFNELI